MAHVFKESDPIHTSSHQEPKEPTVDTASKESSVPTASKESKESKESADSDSASSAEAKKSLERYIAVLRKINQAKSADAKQAQENLISLLGQDDDFAPEKVFMENSEIPRKEFMEMLQKRRNKTMLKPLLSIDKKDLKDYQEFCKQVFSKGAYDFAMDSKELIKHHLNTISKMQVKNLGGNMGLNIFVREEVEPLFIYGGILVKVKSRTGSSENADYLIDIPLDESSKIYDKNDFMVDGIQSDCLSGIIGHSFNPDIVTYHSPKMEKLAAKPILKIAKCYMPDRKIVCAVLIHINAKIKNKKLKINSDPQTIDKRQQLKTNQTLKPNNLVTYDYSRYYWATMYHQSNIVADCPTNNGEVISRAFYHYKNLHIHFDFGRKLDNGISYYGHDWSWDEFNNHHTDFMLTIGNNFIFTFYNSLEQFKQLKTRTPVISTPVDVIVTAHHMQNIKRKLLNILGIDSVQGSFWVEHTEDLAIQFRSALIRMTGIECTFKDEENLKRKLLDYNITSSVITKDNIDQNAMVLIAAYAAEDMSHIKKSKIMFIVRSAMLYKVAAQLGEINLPFTPDALIPRNPDHYPEPFLISYQPKKIEQDQTNTVKELGKEFDAENIELSEVASPLDYINIKQKFKS